MKRTWAAVFLSLIFSFVFVSCGNSKTVVPDLADSAEQTTETAITDDEEFVEDPLLLSYRIDEENNCATILGRGEWQGTDLVIPSEIGGIPVTAIAEQAFRGGSGLRSVVVPESVTVIGFSAFAECHKLEEITLPSAHVAGDGETEKPLGFIFGVVAYDAQWPMNLTSITISGGTDIPASTFQYNHRVETIWLGESITAIGEFAFYGCHNLKKVNLSDCLTKIGDCAFTECWAMDEIRIPERVTEIGSNAFSVCTRLTEVVIPDSVQTIGQGAFYRCEKLKSITVGNGVTVIEPETFESCDSLYQVMLGNRVREIGERAFENCKGLLTLTLPDSVSIIRTKAFYGSNLRSLSVGNGLTRIEELAFERLRVHVAHADLEEIVYRGTEEEWDAVEKIPRWDYGAGSYTIRFEEAG